MIEDIGVPHLPCDDPDAGIVLVDLIITPETISKEKAKIAGVVADMDSFVKANAGSIPAGVAAAYVSWHRSRFEPFMADVPNILTAPMYLGKCRTMQSEARDWQLKLGSYGELGMPLLSSPSPSLLGQGAQGAVQAADDAASTIKTVAIVGGVAFVALAAVIGLNAFGWTKGLAEGAGTVITHHATRKLVRSNPRRRRRR